jgi:hypothetical protein
MRVSTLVGNSQNHLGTTLLVDVVPILEVDRLVLMYEPVLLFEKTFFSFII